MEETDTIICLKKKKQILKKYQKNYREANKSKKVLIFDKTIY